MKIIVALGNPGEQYKNTRHNLGWMAIDKFLGNVHWEEIKKLNSYVYRDKDYVFVKPTTFMNKSGEAVQKVVNYYKVNQKILGIIKKKNIDLSHTLLVVHDDIDLDFGTKKISVNSGSAGHNGIKSIINHLKTKNFVRLRLGIRNELMKTKIPTEKFVLQNFSSLEKEKLDSLLSDLDLTDII